MYFYEDGQENLLNEHGEKFYAPMEDVSTQIDDPNIVLETITNPETYLSAKRPPKKKLLSYGIYSDTSRESFIDRMKERGLVAKVTRELNVEVPSCTEMVAHL
ncbi:hypothetical protein INT47_006547 [Mucor saturninus]|uniref:Uncharacterized protein n=1 Tax=Mucor saturninus TaxID=64648 RepID=A0A8H7QYH2_9FUNG|nr:hypothetical protein INT47_006547 [Mucor saturninus]